MFLDRLLKPFHTLLAPAGGACLACGRTAELHREHFGVCRSCYRSISWIMKPRCLYCGRHFGCPDCTRSDAGPWHFVRNRSAVAYNGDMREWLAQYKYRGNEKFEFLLSRMLTQAYRQMQQEFDDQLRQGIRSQTLAGSGTPMNPYWQAHLVTSVPISESRLRERGFNQAEKLARGLASACRLPYAELLVRARHTDKQSFKGRMDRLKNMEGIFDLSPGSGGHISRFYKEHIRSETLFNPHAPLRILLVDDIYTTGSTVNACSGIIKAAGEAAGTPVEIYSLTWARS
ncbi:hypothetical protein XI25_03185 [Paenibacillus sp. DMB20]|nr:hypothetical protein XI25_03185 [Paenibacillus sp. DMB20]